jgi:hypothetical protein
MTDFSVAGKIKNVIRGKRTLEIQCEQQIIKVHAIADCCSNSWFEYPSQLSLNKVIRSIRKGNHIEMPPSEVQEIDKNYHVTIEFTDGNHEEFILRNSSNGYYDGWIEISVNQTVI